MKRSNAEDRLQMAVVTLLKRVGKPGLFWFHVPNEGKRSVVTGSRNKAMGVVRGVPDLVLIWRGRSIGLELKTEKGRITEDQKLVQEAWTLAGGLYKVCRGYAEAVIFLADMAQCIRPVQGIEGLEPRQQPGDAA